MLSWLINDQNVETGYLSLTRGDGGQNLLGTEQGAALGLIRTHELLEARKLDGAQQFFTRAIDFGFSKNTTDTFKQWDENSIIADVVWVIRQFRPNVIICRFPPTAAAGHGQHAASAVVAEKLLSWQAIKRLSRINSNMLMHGSQNVYCGILSALVGSIRPLKIN